MYRNFIFYLQQSLLTTHGQISSAQVRPFFGLLQPHPGLKRAKMMEIRLTNNEGYL